MNRRLGDGSPKANAGTYVLGAVFLTSFMGLGAEFGLPGYAGKLYLSQIVLFLGIVYVLVVEPVISPSVRRSSLLIPLIAFLAVSLLPGLIMSGGSPSALLAYLNWVLGLVAGVLLGNEWSRLGDSRWNSVDWFLLCGLVIATFQLLSRLFVATEISGLHSSARVPWGNSNYVAAVIVVLSLIVVARMLDLGVSRWILLVPLVCVCSALLTLSRGAIVAAIAGGCVYGLRIPKSSRLYVLRYLGLLAPIAVVWSVLWVNNLRTERAEVNVEVRFELYRLALSQFSGSPLAGTGWAAMRSASSDSLGEQQTFAHNLVLSFLQIGGLMAVPFLVAIFSLIWYSFRYSVALAAPLVAGLSVSVTEPFFEGYISGMLVWALFAFCLAGRGSDDAMSRSEFGNSAALHFGVKSSADKLNESL